MHAKYEVSRWKEDKNKKCVYETLCPPHLLAMGVVTSTLTFATDCSKKTHCNLFSILQSFFYIACIHFFVLECLTFKKNVLPLGLLFKGSGHCDVSPTLSLLYFFCNNV